MEGPSAMTSGCANCHSIGKPNDDGTIGTCTACHTRHTSSVAIARLPTTCGQCHMGPDHSQLEIYEESKHGIMFHAQERLLNLDAPPASLTTRDMFVPTCATCHMSGLNGQKVTHDPSDRLSYYLADPITKPRPNKAHAQEAMKQLCNQCHARPLIDRVYAEAEKVVADTNVKVQQAGEIMAGLRKDGVLTTAPFSQPIDFVYFDLWHYDGRTSKHGAFMGGADFVQWHGNYPMLARTVEMRAMADELRRRHGRP
jgi:hydroxylamine dehydrogenase